MSDVNRDSQLRENNEAIYRRMRSGETGARNELIENNINFVGSRVKACVRDNPRLAFLRHDLMSEGLLALTQVVDRLQRGDVTHNPTGYIYVAVQNAIGHLIDNELSLAPDRSQRRARAKGEFLDAPREQSLFVRDMVDGCATEGTTIREPAAPDYTAVFELREEIEACCTDDTERAVIRLREDGNLDREISDQLGLTEYRVAKIRSTVYRRFLTRTGMKGEAA